MKLNNAEIGLYTGCANVLPPHPALQRIHVTRLVPIVVHQQLLPTMNILIEPDPLIRLPPILPSA
jgi:hypothetical protein